MDLPPENEQIEKLNQGYDVTDLDGRISDAADVQPEQAPPAEGKPELAQTAVTEVDVEAQPKSEVVSPSKDQPKKKVEPHPKAQPASATGEVGDAERAETGGEKPK